MNQFTALRTLAAGAILLATAGAAVAQSSASGDEFKRPLGGGRAKVSRAAPRAPQPEQSSHSITVMRQDDGDNTVELRIENGEYSAKLNGKEVPQDRIIQENDEVRVLGKDGNAVSTFHISTDPIAGSVVEGVQPPAPAKAPKPPKAPRAAGRATPANPAQPPVPAQPMANPPKVMLGITMDTPSDSLLKNYSLKEGEAILVQRVVEGLPADKAGLNENDIITEIDGKRPVNQEILREILRSKEPGDTVEFTVLRKGGDKSLRITLDKFDQEKLGSVWNVAPGQGPDIAWGRGEGGDANAAMKDAEKAMRDAMKNHQWPQTFTMPDGGQGRAFVLGNAGPDTDKKLAELNKKMADLDKKLERVDAQMAKLQELLEKLSKQNGR